MDTSKGNGVFLFGQRLQYRIPLFQRHYVWDKEDQWKPLWNDLKENAHRGLSQTQNQKFSHFTGAIVIQQLRTAPGNVPKYEIIDGQQRLTTFQIILCVIRDICKSDGHNDVADEAHLYIRNQGMLLNEDEEYKLIPTMIDRDSFISLVNEHQEESKGRIRSAYDYFKTEITNHVKSDRQKALSLLRSLLNDFGFVQILIDDGDEPAKIFESLNARGKSLLEFDLLRNHLFLRAHEDRDNSYKKYWEHFEDPYWDPEEKKGASCEHFLQHFLMTKLGTEDVKPEFNTYQRRYCRKLEREGTYEIEYEFSELKRYSKIYAEMTDCDDCSEIGRRMKFYQTFKLTTLHPFILFIICEVGLVGDSLNRVFDILESYTLRRMLCCGGKRALKRFNIFFSQLISDLKDDFTLERFIDRLSSECSDTHRYPTNDEINPALHTRHDAHSTLFPDDTTIVFPNNLTVQAALHGLWVNTAGPIKQSLIRYILYRIELMKREEDQFTESLVFKDRFTTLEHVLPQAWMDKWKLPFSEGAITYDDSGGIYRVLVNRKEKNESMLYEELFSNDYKAKTPGWKNQPSRDGLADESYSDAYNLTLARNHCLGSIGNLTIVTRELNSKLKNRTFSEKKKDLETHSKLILNAEICKNGTWDVNEIYKRAERLIKDVCKIWPSLDVFREEQ